MNPKRSPRTFALLLLGLVAGSWVATHAVAVEDQPADKELAKLAGEWSMVSGTADGFPIPEAMLHDFKRVCKADEVTVTNGQQLIMKAKITLDPAKNPKTIDFDVIDGPTKGKKQLGIYELDGETFKSCFGAPDEARPTDFNSVAGDHRTSTVWKRSK